LLFPLLSGCKNNFTRTEPLTSIIEIFNRIGQLAQLYTSHFIDQEEAVLSPVSIISSGDQLGIPFQWYLFVLSLPPSLNMSLPFI
jgi:hypothetical protein